MSCNPDTSKAFEITGNIKFGPNLWNYWSSTAGLDQTTSLFPKAREISERNSTLIWKWGREAGCDLVSKISSGILQRRNSLVGRPLKKSLDLDGGHVENFHQYFSFLICPRTFFYFVFCQTQIGQQRNWKSIFCAYLWKQSADLLAGWWPLSFYCPAQAAALYLADHLTQSHILHHGTLQTWAWSESLRFLSLSSNRSISETNEIQVLAPWSSRAIKKIKMMQKKSFSRTLLNMLITSQLAPLVSQNDICSFCLRIVAAVDHFL